MASLNADMITVFPQRYLARIETVSDSNAVICSLPLQPDPAYGHAGYPSRRQGGNHQAAYLDEPRTALEYPDTSMPEDERHHPSPPKTTEAAAARSDESAQAQTSSPHIDYDAYGTPWASATASARYPDGTLISDKDRSCVEVAVTTLI